EAMTAGGAVLVEGTCDELGRLASWLTVSGAVPRTLTLAARLSTLDTPATLAERLPKALIHDNVPGRRIHDLVGALDEAWGGGGGARPVRHLRRPATLDPRRINAS